MTVSNDTVSSGWVWILEEAEWEIGGSPAFTTDDCGVIAVVVTCWRICWLSVVVRLRDGNLHTDDITAHNDKELEK